MSIINALFDSIGFDKLPDAGRDKDGKAYYINITPLEERYNFQALDWLQEESTQEYLKHTANKLNLDDYTLLYMTSDVDLSGEYPVLLDKVNVWITPIQTILIKLARDISPTFAIRYNQHIWELLTTGETHT